MKKAEAKTLQGLEPLGTRLKELRVNAGLSQARLAQRMGFQPAHGYKYVFRLEKGLVRNPTLRTITAYLAGCGVGWDALSGVLPGFRCGADTSLGPTGKPGKPTEEKARSLRRGPDRDSRPAVPELEADLTFRRGPATPADPTIRSQESQPLRVRLRESLKLRRSERFRDFWFKVERAEDAVAKVLHEERVVTSAWRDYFALARSLLLMIQTYASARPDTAERQMENAMNAPNVKGLDERIARKVKSVCLDVFFSRTGLSS